MRIDISKVNKNISKNPKLLENGVEIIKSFLSKHEK